MNTFFAPAERVEPGNLVEEIQAINRSPVMTGLLRAANGLLAVVNGQRQIIATNDSFLSLLGINDPAGILGLRPGEALRCPHSCKEPGGCGTSRYCRTCGAVIAMLSSMQTDLAAEETCSLTATIQGKSIDLVLKIRSQPVEIEDKTFLLLFLQDITAQENTAALERTFYHDISNILCGLLGSAELLCMNYQEDELVKNIMQMSFRLKKEIEIQKSILRSQTGEYVPFMESISTGRIHQMLTAFFANHPAAERKTLHCHINHIDRSFECDHSLLLRILCNMITNALEATTEEQPVTVWVEEEQHPRQLVFCVHNAQEIPADISLRIFEHHFSTKSGSGRGNGTYSMKLFGENVLGGKASFITSSEQGTVFRFALPI